MLVPDLRPLSVGEIIDVAIKIWRRHLPTLARIVFVVVAPVQVLAALVAASVSSPDNVFNRVDANGQPSIDTHALAGWLAGMFTAQSLSFLAFLIASAAVLRAVSVAYLGGTPEWRDSLRAATGRLGSLIWLGLLMGGGLALSAVALFVPFIWLGVSWSVAFPVLIAEGERGTGAMRRSFRLVRGRWWPTFGALLLALLFQFVLGLIVGIPLAFLTANWDTGSTAAIAVRTVLSIASSVITTPFMAAVLVLIYFDLRVRKEGFDLELLSQGVGVPGAALPPRGPWVPPGGQWVPPGGWAAPGGAWPAPAGWPAPGPPDAPGPYDAPPGPYGAPPGPYDAPPGPYDAPPPRPYDAPPGPYDAPSAPADPAGGWEAPIDPTGWGPPPAGGASPEEPTAAPPPGEQPERP